jgi:hypothetical protein
MVDLLAQTSLGQPLLYFKNVFVFFYKTTYLNEVVKCIEPSQIVFLGRTQWANMLGYQFTRIKRFLNCPLKVKENQKQSFLYQT